MPRAQRPCPACAWPRTGQDVVATFSFVFVVRPAPRETRAACVATHPFPSGYASGCVSRVVLSGMCGGPADGKSKMIESHRTQSGVLRAGPQNAVQIRGESPPQSPTGSNQTSAIRAQSVRGLISSALSLSGSPESLWSRDYASGHSSSGSDLPVSIEKAHSGDRQQPA
ncbi:hypothetical protein P885DRAFT_57132 [Corynascus similis CBS 632.67]